MIALHQGSCSCSMHPCTPVSVTGGSGMSQRERLLPEFLGCDVYRTRSLLWAFVAKCLWIKSLLSRCLFRLSHGLIVEHPPENWEIHTWKRLGDWEVLRKKHRGRLPLQLENKAHACLWIEDQGGHPWNLYSQAAAMVSVGSVSPFRDGLGEQSKSNHNKVCKANL